jgi:hypothetical protein
MSSLHLSSPTIYLFLLWISLLAVFFITARPARCDEPTPDIDQRFSWKWLKPAPEELRRLMRVAARRRGFPQGMLDSLSAEYAARVSEGVKRIRGEA